MRDIALVIIVFGSLPLIFRRPWIGILMFSWISYMLPHRLTWGFAYDMPFAAITALATLISLPFAKEEKSIPINSLSIVWILFILHVSITTIFAVNPGDAVSQWSQVIKIQIMAMVTIILINDKKRLDALIWVLVLSIGFYGIKGGIFSLLNNLQYRVWGPPGGFFEGNNELALALIMILPLMRYLYLDSANKWIKRALLVAMGLCAISIIGSYSRGAFVAGSVMALALAWQSRRRVALLSVMCFAAVLITPYLPDKWTDRMGTIQTYEEDGSAMGRINSWHFAYNLAKDRPITGGGFDTFTKSQFEKYAPDPDDFHDSHSIYFGTLAEHGFVGLGLFMMIGVLSLRRNSKIRRRVAEIPELQWAGNLSSMLGVSIIGYAVGGLFLGLQYFDLFYHLIALTLIVESVAAKMAPVIRAKKSGMTADNRDGPNPTNRGERTSVDISTAYRGHE